MVEHHCHSSLVLYRIVVLLKKNDARKNSKYVVLVRTRTYFELSRKEL
jgi:hypothetical protein